LVKNASEFQNLLQNCFKVATHHWLSDVIKSLIQV